VPANVAKGSLIRRGFTANACLLRGSGTVNARRTRSLAHAPAASNCRRSSTGSFRGYDPGGATAFEIYVTETKKLERLPDILGLQAGSLGDPSIFRLAMDVFTASAQPWDHMYREVQKTTQGPPV